MSQNKMIGLGPKVITNAVTNMFNPPTLTGGVSVGGTNTYVILKRIRIINKTSSAVTYTLYIGATGAAVAGTEFMGAGRSVPANGVDDFYCNRRLDVADFLTAIASTNTALVIEAAADIGIA